MTCISSAHHCTLTTIHNIPFYDAAEAHSCIEYAVTTVNIMEIQLQDVSSQRSCQLLTVTLILFCIQKFDIILSYRSMTSVLYEKYNTLGIS